MDDSQILRIKYIKNTRNTENKLKSIHEKSNLSINFFYGDFILVKPQRIENMAKIIYQMLELPNKLKVMGKDIKDNHVRIYF